MMVGPELRCQALSGFPATYVLAGLAGLAGSGRLWPPLVFSWFFSWFSSWFFLVFSVSFWFFRFPVFPFLDCVSICSCSTNASFSMSTFGEDSGRPETISAIRTWIFGLLESFKPPNSSPSLWPALATTHGNSQEIRKLTMSRRGLGTPHGDPQPWPALLRAHRGFSSSTGIVSNGYLSR